MTEQAADPDDGQDIKRQFALLQAEMQRVMAAPTPDPAGATGGGGDEAAADFQRLEQGIQELRRDADRLRARMTQADEDAAAGAAIAALGARVDAADKRGELAAQNLAQFIQETRQSIDSIERRLDFLARRRPASWPLPLTILLGALVIAAAVVLTAPGQMPGPIKALIDRVEGAVAPAQPHAENAAPTPPPAPVAAPEKTAEAPPPAAPLPSPAAPPAAPVVVAQDPAPAPEPAAPAVTPPAAPQATPLAAAPAPVAAAPPAAHDRIVLRARGDVWVEVRNRQGGALIARTLHDGESWAVPDQPGLVLATGNAGGLDVLVDGVASPPLGGMGMVRRDVPLDPDLLRAGRTVADTSARAKPLGTSR